MKLGIRAKLFLLSLGLILASTVVGYGYLRVALEHSLSEQISSDLRVRARLVKRDAEMLSAPLEQSPAWETLVQNLGPLALARVTLIRADGLVMGDSDVPGAELSTVENHADRPEVRAALAGKPGTDVRLSASVQHRMLYVAEPLERGGSVVGVVRLALPLARVDAAIGQIERVGAIAFLLAIGFAVLMSSFGAQLASQPARALTDVARSMAAGNLEARSHAQGTDELGALGRALDRLAENLSATLGDLRAERDRLGGILSGMHEGVLLLDREGRVALVNPALRETLLLPSDAEGKPPLEVIRHAELKELLDEAAEGEEAQSREIELGGLKPLRLLVRASPLAGKEGGVLAVFVDVTQMRRLETVRRDFVANVSHELRTPVAAIRSAAETLQGALTRDPDAAHGFVEIIDRNADRLGSMLEDLLDLSRIESRKYALSPESLELGEVAGHVAELFRERADKKQIRLSVDVAESPATCRADRRALEHVLTNLIDNAVKYCGAGAEVHVLVSRGEKGWRIAVQDSGPGIEARHLPRLFERFYRVDAGRSRELGGTGLGLSIVKHLVEAMGSQVIVKSDLGKGTEFSFALPSDPSG